MNAVREFSIAELRGPILRDVSRSFFLSLRILPQSLRDPISVAYLLARATDTIADTVAIAASQRAQALPLLIAAIEGHGDANDLRDSFARLQTNAAERALIESLPRCLAWLEALDESDRRDVREVLGKIARGQLLDLQRFGITTEIHALASAQELDDYTYLVAGCVGEFWTRICARKLPDFSLRGEPEMAGLGVQYGQGLQLTNILRDAGNDLRAGRCYLPGDELRAIGLQPNDLLARPAPAAPVIARWLSKAEAGLHAGVEYASAIRRTRVRIATALPALIGLRTIRMMNGAGTRLFSEHIKITRRDVRALVIRAFAFRASPDFLQAEATENTSAASR